MSSLNEMFSASSGVTKIKSLKVPLESIGRLLNSKLRSLDNLESRILTVSVNKTNISHNPSDRSPRSSLGSLFRVLRKLPDCQMWLKHWLLRFDTKCLPAYAEKLLKWIFRGPSLLRSHWTTPNIVVREVIKIIKSHLK